ncbi:MAG: hypothetical protein MI863_19150 [Desulfobacterales bacterium]|nr:hypothetical protein [Desulfobacterales bacterium]
MATKKSPKTGKGAPRFYVTKTIGEVRGKIEDRVNEYNEKFIKKPVESSREFLSDLKADPVKTIDDLIDDGKEAIEKEKKARIKAFRKSIDGKKQAVRKKMDKLNAEAKKVYAGINSDAKLLVKDAKEMGKKQLDRIPMKKAIEKKITKGIDAIPSKLNLPSKDEIDNLVTGIDGVNKKVDAINKGFAKT